MPGKDITTMNRVILMGRLTKNPEIKYAGKDNNMAVARYTLAVNRRYKRDGEQEADFISCVTFGKSAEFAQKYLHNCQMEKKEKQQKQKQSWREGQKLIRELLADKKEISIRELDEKAKEQGISRRTMRDVRSRMKNELEYRVNEKQENSIRLKE